MILALAAMALGPAMPPGQTAQCPVSAHWTEGPPDEEGRIIVPAKNLVTVGPSGLSWNFEASNLPIILRYAGIIREMDPRPWLVVDASAADCAELRQVAEMIEAAAACEPDYCFVSREPVKREPMAQIILPRPGD